MAVLTSQQRNTLETAVKEARKLAETGAFNALHAFAVDNHEPFSHMSAEQRALRNRLRHKARLLGDELPSTGHQQIEHLSYELAYETWHKMLFAKFLEANGLLMHPDGVAVTMEECEELAKDEGFIDKWDTAATYASKMLPAIFRIDDPLMQINFATNDRIKLEETLDSLDNTVFTSDDALGWVYQYWQVDAKKKVEEEEKSGQKIDGKRLPAKTQLFTEPYMVDFLIDNTLGAWWVSRNPGVIPPVKFEYLRLLDDGTPAAGKFEGWPNQTAEVTSMDPSMGSGHFIGSLFTIFVNLRMFEENLTKELATKKVITENLHGLELDPRCTQLAAFNLALVAWKFCGEYLELPEMNVACCGIAPKGRVEDWVKLVGKVEREEDKLRMENGMRELYDHFQLAPELGSLLDPTTIKAGTYTASFDQLKPVLIKALVNEADKDVMERGVMAAGIAKAGQLLAKKYTLQITNVPYLEKGKQDEILAKHCLTYYPEGKGDLATVFLEKMLKSNAKRYGTVCIVIPQNWIFQPTYKSYRKKLLKEYQLQFITTLGAKGFQTPMWDFNVMLISCINSNPNQQTTFFGLDLSNFKNPENKAIHAKTSDVRTLSQFAILSRPDFRIMLNEQNKGDFLTEFAVSQQGITTGDSKRYGAFFWEYSFIDNSSIVYWQSTTSEMGLFKGRSLVLKWDTDGHKIISEPAATLRGLKTKGKSGILVSSMGKLNVTLSTGEISDDNTARILPNDSDYSLPIWCYCSSENYHNEIRNIDQALKVMPNTLLKVPFDLEYWQKVASEKYPNGLPKPYSEDATQWLFHGYPIKAENPLQVAVARLLGYCWPPESDTEMELAEEARELIREVKTFDYLTDDDGIFCIPSVNAESAGADRLRAYLQEVFGSTWDNKTTGQLLAKEDAKSTNLEDWLRKEFFIQHCKVFQNRPFIWHIWDGRNDGFSALVNYHKLNKENLVKLIYTYLGDWIRLCEDKKKAGESGAEGLYSAAIKLKEKLEAIFEGETPYDIFVRWKPLEQQPIGWDPDLNDGVRLNIRPFVEAGVLRSKFNVKWGVDRGKNPPGSPWGEIRDNDRHLSLAEKREARKKL